MGSPVEDRERVLRTFLRDGRLVSMPARAAKRRVVLEHIVAVFEPGVRIPEPEVDAVLRSIYPQDYVCRCAATSSTPA
jgi:hypothetical protein